MNSDVANLDMVTLGQLIRARKLSPVTLVETTLEHIGNFDTQLNSFVHLNKNALNQAKEAERTLQFSNNKIGALHGIPIAVKDNYLTEDMPTTVGTTASGYAFEWEDAEAVRRLRRAGAILIGKTRTHEFAWGTVTPPTRNPWDLQRIPGGSSGGSGTAVAARLCAAALGSDTGGSIRIPASLCGVVGLKPTYGRVSRVGVVPHSWSLDHAGPLTRSVRDAALMLQIMAGHDPSDAGSRDEPVPSYLDGLDIPIAGLRVGICRNHFFDNNEPAVNAAVEHAISDLAAAGTQIVDLQVDQLEYGLGAIYAIELASSSAYHDQALRSGATKGMNKDVRTLVEIGRLVSGSDMIKAEQLRTILMDNFQKVFKKIDVLLTPTLPLTAWCQDEDRVMIGDQSESPLAASWRLTYPFNLTGLPAISVPCGFDHRNLPIGLQFVARPFDEATLLRVAHAYEKIGQWNKRIPPIRSDIL